MNINANGFLINIIENKIYKCYRKERERVLHRYKYFNSVFYMLEMKIL